MPEKVELTVPRCGKVEAAEAVVLDVPEKVELTVPRCGKVEAKADGPVQFVSADKDLEVVLVVGNTAVVQALKPGQTYRLFAIAAKDSRPVLKVITIKTVGDAPAPGPGPAPAPVPTPVDPLAAELAALYAAEQSPAKKDKSLALARVYTGVEDLVKKAATGSEVIAALRERAAAEKIEAADLTPMRAAIARRMAAALPTKAADPLTDANRKAVIDLCAVISTTLRVARSFEP